jgi:hypothetical protein
VFLTAGALLGSGRLSAANLTGKGSMSAPSRSWGYSGKRSWNCGSPAIVCGVLTGAIGKFFSPPSRIHSADDFAANTSRRMTCSSRLPRAWSANFEPGQRSNRSLRPMHSQKFFQKACSLAISNTCPSADS